MKSDNGCDNPTRKTDIFKTGHIQSVWVHHFVIPRVLPSQSVLGCARRISYFLSLAEASELAKITTSSWPFRGSSHGKTEINFTFLRTGVNVSFLLRPEMSMSSQLRDAGKLTRTPSRLQEKQGSVTTCPG